MRYLVVSDNHGDQGILEKLLARYENDVTAVIHCGDSELDYDAPIVQQMTIVGGNMDFDGRFPATATLQFDNDRIFVAHGHRLSVNFGLGQLYQAALQNKANLIFYGHTHQLACTMEDGRLLLNPGSISQPRGEFAALHGTYALVQTSETAVIVDYYNRQLLRVPELHFEFQR